MKKLLKRELVLFPKKVIETDGGNVLHVLKKSDNYFNGFGEIYCSELKQGKTRPWKKHKEMTCSLVVILGAVSFRTTKDFKKFENFELSREKYNLLQIPPETWFSFTGNEPHNILINVANIEHSEGEVVRFAEEDR